MRTQNKHISKAFHMAISFSALLFVIMTIFSIALVLFLTIQIKANQKKALTYTTDIIEKHLDILTNSENINPPADSSLPDRFLLPKTDSLPRVPGFMYYCVYQKESKKLYFYSHKYLSELKPAPKSSSITSKNLDDQGDLSLFYITKETSIEPFGNIVIVVAMNMNRNEQVQILKAFPTIMAVFAAPLLLIAFLAALFITKHTLKPVAQITADVLNFSKDMNYRFPVSQSQDEFDRLSITFNKLFDQIQNDFNREKQFTSDVSHELKTPLAVIQGHTNLIRRWGKDDPVQLEKSINFLTQEVDSMKYIINNLLTLSRLDNKTVSVNIEEIPVLDILNRLKADTAVWSKNTEVRIQSSLNPDTLENLKIKTDRELIYEAWTNIVSNSIKFSTDKAPQIIFKIEQNNGITITFSDNGPGIPPEDIPHIFERFYRSDKSHNRKIPGNGLGLSIVKTITDNTNASVECKSILGQGTDMIFTFRD